MKIRELVSENFMNRRGKIHPEHERGLNNTSTHPGQNMYHGSGYFHGKFVQALAGAGAGKTPDASMGDENWGGGDPITSPYHEVEKEMIDRAKKHIGDSQKVDWGAKESQEPQDVNRSSPVPHNSGQHKKRKR